MPAEKNPPSSPQWNAFLESLKEEYPEEFGKKTPTLEAFLHDADQNIAVAEGYLDNPFPIERLKEAEVEDEVTEDEDQ